VLHCIAHRLVPRRPYYPSRREIILIKFWRKKQIKTKNNSTQKIKYDSKNNESCSCSRLWTTLKIEEVPVREPGRYEVLVKVIACGVCHTDLHAVDGDWPAKPKMPLIPGHEGVGIVVACGPEAFVKKEML
jgi:hypothetical protein